MASISSFGSLSEVLVDLAGLEPEARGAFSLGNPESFKETLATELGVNITDEDFDHAKAWTISHELSMASWRSMPLAIP